MMQLSCLIHALHYLNNSVVVFNTGIIIFCSRPKIHNDHSFAGAGPTEHAE
jgi:hypothetical protein